MQISIIDEQSDLPIATSSAEALVDEVLRFEGKHCDEVAIHFVDIASISQLHSEFFGDPTPTDCISFPIDEPNAVEYCLLGEVFVCPTVAIQYAKEHQLCPFEETTLYIVHGLLHLLGYDDVKEDETKIMRAAERRHMDNLRKKNLVLRSKK